MYLELAIKISWACTLQQTKYLYLTHIDLGNLKFIAKFAL